MARDVLGPSPPRAPGQPRAPSGNNHGGRQAYFPTRHPATLSCCVLHAARGACPPGVHAARTPGSAEPLQGDPCVPEASPGPAARAPPPCPRKPLPGGPESICSSHQDCGYCDPESPDLTPHPPAHRNMSTTAWGPLSPSRSPLRLLPEAGIQQALGKCSKGSSKQRASRGTGPPWVLTAPRSAPGRLERGQTRFGWRARACPPRAAWALQEAPRTCAVGRGWVNRGTRPAGGPRRAP